MKAGPTLRPLPKSWPIASCRSHGHRYDHRAIIGQRERSPKNQICLAAGWVQSLPQGEELTDEVLALVDNDPAAFATAIRALTLARSLEIEIEKNTIANEVNAGTVTPARKQRLKELEGCTGKMRRDAEPRLPSAREMEASIRRLRGIVEAIPKLRNHAEFSLHNPSIGRVTDETLRQDAAALHWLEKLLRQRGKQFLTTAKVGKRIAAWTFDAGRPGTPATNEALRLCHDLGKERGLQYSDIVRRLTSVAGYAELECSLNWEANPAAVGKRIEERIRKARRKGEKPHVERNRRKAV